MTRQRLAALRAALMLTDATVTAVVFAVAGRLRFGPDWYTVWETLLPRPMMSLVLYAFVAVATFWLVGLYQLRARWTLRAEVRDLLQAVFLLVIVTFSLLYLFKLDQVSRLLLVYFFMLEAATIAVTRTGLRWFFRWLRKQGRGMRRTLIVGSGSLARRYLESMTELPELGVLVVGFVGAPYESLDGIVRLGAVDELADVLADQIIDDVAVCLPFSQWGDLDDLIRICEIQGKTVRIPVISLERVVSHGSFERVGSLPVMTMSRTPDRVLAMAVKRLMDIGGSIVGMVVFSPVMLAIGVIILLKEGGPILYVDHRAGLNGRPINVHKFRTMVPDANALRTDLAARNDRTGPDFKVNDDPRVTPIGRFLRAASLDELPQFWDVFTGRMSLVGPRAQRLDEAAGYDSWHHIRLSVKPGITGLWQVTERMNPDFDRRVELDSEYIEHWTLAQDLRILVQTIPAVFARTGR